ncbi:MAG TPA: S16 family serine protease, partial [Actinomycetota bacterium]|nr:S16 family serine protease [Actinomycetota bacterium]
GLTVYAVDLPFFSVGPGPAREVNPRIDIDGRRTFESRGRLMLTTVNLGRVNVFSAFDAWVDPAVDVVSERSILAPGETDRQHRQQSNLEMDESKIAAVAVALRRVTGYPREHGDGVLIQDVIEGAPASGRLFPGELILAADGEAIDGLDQMRSVISGAGTGRDLRLTVRSGDERRTVSIRPIRRPEDDRPIIGVVLVENFPFDIRIDSGDVGGPSAGLMWALGVMDLLTPGDLTSGRTVAGTGVIDLEGGVHPVGGIEHKVLAAEREGAELFLLPEANLNRAREVAQHIDLVPVDRIEEALNYLEGGS